MGPFVSEARSRPGRWEHPTGAGECQTRKALSSIRVASFLGGAGERKEHRSYELDKGEEGEMAACGIKEKKMRHVPPGSRSGIRWHRGAAIRLHGPKVPVSVEASRTPQQ